jgi:hypothetical protein
MLSDFLSSKYPAGDISDGEYLYRSLGSFWTQIFQDKNVLKGYTIGMAEELIQSYYTLIETIQKYAVRDTPVLHKEKWLPLTIKKSDFNKAPFVFSSNGAVFGYQPDSDDFYANQLFRFGFPKETGGKHVYSYTPKNGLQSFGAIANRVIAPSLLLVPGIDVSYVDGVLYFNSDLFKSEYIPRSKVLGDLGKTSTYKDADGNVIEDEFIILWVYAAEIDQKALYENFGVLFELNLPSSQNYKDVLVALMNLASEGSTITALNSAFAALADIPVIIETKETVKNLYDDRTYNYVVTDKNVYRVPIDQPLSEKVYLSNVLYSGECVTSDVKILDTVIDPVWWKKEIATNKLAFSSHIFAASTHSQLFFENDIKLISYTGSQLNFPVIGKPEDVKSFQQYINTPDVEGVEGNQTKLLRVLNLTRGQAGGAVINPIDFVFNNIFKNNILLLKLQFYTNEQLIKFFELFPIIQSYLPPHVYVLLYLSLSLDVEELLKLNSTLTIPGFLGQKFSSDGSNRLTGSRPILSGGDENYYKDYANRLFCVSVGPYRNDEPLHTDNNLEVFTINNATTIDSSPGIKGGILRTEIPLYVQPAGETSRRQPSTREIPAILLIDF